MEPEADVSREESILAALNQDLEPISPDKTGERQEKREVSSDLMPPDEPREEAPAPETQDESIDEAALLKQFKLDNYDRLESALEEFSKTREKASTIGDLLKRAGMEVSDDPLQDLSDLIEARLAEQAGLVSGTHTPPAGPTAPPPVNPTLEAQRTGDGIRNFLTRYPTLKWNEVVLQDLAAALRDNLGIQPPPKTDDFVSRREVEPMAKMNRHLFEQTMIQDHIISRLANGDKLPPDYRTRLTEQVQKNPQLMERAIRGYLIRGRAGDVMSEYAKGIPVERDPSTGLTKAEADAQAAEQRRLAANKKMVSGGDAPGKPDAKRTPSIVDLEKAIERAGKRII